MRNLLLISSILFYFFCFSISAQDGNWIILLSNGDTLNASSINTLTGDSISISSLANTQWIKVDSIIEIDKIKDSKFWEGAGIGFGAGAACGALIGLAAYEKPKPGGFITLDFGPGINALGGGIIGGLSGFMAGGIIGALSSTDEIYKLADMQHESKLALIRSLLSEPQ